MILHVGHCVEFGDGAGDPLRRWHAVDRAAVRQQPAAERNIFFAEDDARAGATRRKRGGKARGSRADNQHVAMRPGLFVVVGIGGCRGAAETCGAADQRLIELFPERAGHMKVL